VILFNLKTNNTSGSDAAFVSGRRDLLVTNVNQIEYGRIAAMKRGLVVAVAVVLAAVGCTHTGATKADIKTAQTEAATAAAKREADQAAKEQDRQKILSMKDITLADLYKQKPKAKDEIEKAAGYAVFDASGVFVVLYVGVEGRGVMIDKSNGEATYMTMARAGTGPGVGYEQFRYVIVFKSKKLVDTFKTVGGDIGASGHLVAKGFDMGGSVGTQMSFDPELSVYQITEDGLAAEASWGATAFVPDPFLNPEKPSPAPAKQPAPPAALDKK
jgi:lipid-binding SYLF domain-containing protein